MSNKTKTYYSIGEFAKLINKSVPTLRHWDSIGVFKADHRTVGGKRFYHHKQLEEVRTKFGTNKISLNEENKNTRKVYGYCRVSSKKQQDDLERQIENLKTYLYAKGYEFEIITDVGSGINYTKQGLTTLIEKVINEEVDKIVVLYKDRLVRFGFELIEQICKLKNTEIVVVDSHTKSKEEELVEDLIQIVTVLRSSCKLQGKRSKQTKTMIEQLKVNI